MKTRPTGKAPPVQEVLRPARSANFGSDVGVPILQALISGGLLAGFIVFLISQLAPRYKPLLEWWVALTLFFAAAFWFMLLWETRRLLWTIEKWRHEDLDGDGVIGRPRRELSVDVRDGDRRHKLVDSDWLGMDDDNLVRFARGLRQMDDLTEGRWARDRAFPGGINEFRRVRNKLFGAELIEKVYPGRSNSPYRLTAAGRALVRRVLEADGG